MLNDISFLLHFLKALAKKKNQHTAFKSTNY